MCFLPLEHWGNNNDDFGPTLSRSFRQGLVDKAPQMNYDDGTHQSSLVFDSHSFLSLALWQKAAGKTKNLIWPKLLCSNNELPTITWGKALDKRNIALLEEDMNILIFFITNFWATIPIILNKLGILLFSF